MEHSLHARRLLAGATRQVERMLERFNIRD
jgi:hypothetical protein